MTLEQLEKAKELVAIINSTKAGIDQLELLKSKRRDVLERRNYDDGQYSLRISEHSDSSGCCAVLNRYDGNAELLDAIIEILKLQLVGFERELGSI